MKSTIAKKVGLPLFLLAFGGIVGLATFSWYVERAGTDAALQNQLLLRQLRVFVDLAQREPPQDNLRLRERAAGFEEFLSALERGGEVMGRRVPRAPREMLPQIEKIRKQWNEIKGSLLESSGKPGPAGTQSYEQLLDRLELLAKASQQVVESYGARTRALQQQMLVILGVLAALDLLLVLAGIWIVIRYVVRPVRWIKEAAERVEVGDFSRSVPVVGRDELSRLAQTFNSMSANMSGLLEEIELERRSAKASEERLREIVRDAGAVVWEADPETFQFTFVSERAEAILGYPVEQWLTQPDFWAGHIHPDDREWATAVCRRAVKQDSEQEFEYRMLAAGGRVVWIHDAVRVTQHDSGGRRLRGLMVDTTKTKEAERALQKSEATNRALLNAIPDLILRVARDGTYLEFKGAAKDFVLFTNPAEMIGRKASEVLPPDVAAEAMCQLARAFDTHQTQIHEYRLAAEDGCHDYEARLIASGSDEALVIVRDITQRKHVEEALRTAETELRRVMASVSDAIWSGEIDALGHTKCIYYSPVVEKIMGRPLEYYSGPDRWLSTLHSQDRPRMEAALWRIMSGQSTREQAEYRVVWPDGTIHWVRSTVMATRLGEGRIRMDGVDSDISAQKQAEEALRQANEALQAVIRASPLAIYALDMNGNVRSWNPAAERMLGWSEQEALGQRPPFVPDEALEVFYERLERCRRGESLAGLEVSRRRKDGSPIEMSLWTAPLRDATGAVSGIIAVAADMTERKTLEEQLRQSQKMEAVGRLAGGIAHDFNNLLTVITGYGYMLLDDLEPEHALRANVEEILRAVERASALTNQLLAFSRRQIAQPKPLDLTALVLNMDKMLRRVLGEDIELVTELSPDLAKVKADPGQIEQVIMNLVVNSRDAMPGGGKITIETANVELDQEYARIHLTVRPGSYVRLSVTDTGHGMDELTKAHLFEPFFTTKEQGKGTGLGMSTVYGIVKQSDGDISVSSAPGQGTQIDIYLPQIDESVPAIETALTDEALGRGTETILVVEDEAEVRRLVREVLEQHGYTILETGQPEEAVTLCEHYEGAIHLLLTDVVMPQMSGRELAERVAWVRSDMKVLFMSGYTEDAMLRRGVSKPSLAFLKKPFTPGVLARRIRQVLDDHLVEGRAQGEV